MADPFVAEIRVFPLDFTPGGWAPCDGQLLSVSQHPGLFTLLGTTYGGDGTTTFALPDLRGRIPVQAGQGAGLSSRPLGQAGGSETVTLGEAQLPAHTHQQRACGDVADNLMPGPSLSLAISAGGGIYVPASSSPALTPMATGALDTVGGGQAHDNLMPYLALGFFIALEGVFPTHA